MTASGENRRLVCVAELWYVEMDIGGGEVGEIITGAIVD